MLRVAPRFRLRNLSGAAVAVRLTGRLLVYDQGLADLTHDLAERAWILAAVETEGFPVTVCEAREMKSNQ